jgi:ATP-dependent RNA helicase RhlE
MGFTSFGLSDHLVRGVQAAGYSAPTPIQKLAILPAVAGKDLIGLAQTGTGKTAAFVLPMLHRMTANHHGAVRNRHPRALVLAPTRELAQQVQKAVGVYGRFLSLRSTAIYGGASMNTQISELRRGVDVVVATPGRLLDHLKQGNIDLSFVEVLVLDEADRMLDMGFIHDVRKIIAKIPARRQTMMFSATLSPEIASLAAGVLRDPETVEAGERKNPVETITQHFYAARKDSKMDLLQYALDAERMESVLVLSRTKPGADKICHRLERNGVSAVTIHSNRTQAQRERALAGFKQGKFRVLVATDIAARGIDVVGISHVINFDVPQFAEDYIHRIGRTGRAGASGNAITFVGQDEEQYLRRIGQFTGKRLSARPYPGFVASAAPAVHPPSFPAPKHTRHSGPRPEARKNRPHKTQGPTTVGRKKRPARKLESFSSDHSGSWSNY